MTGSSDSPVCKLARQIRVSLSVAACVLHDSLFTASHLHTPDNSAYQVEAIHLPTHDLPALSCRADSFVREQMMPGLIPQYAGYVAWRGIVAEASLPLDVKALLANKYTIFKVSASTLALVAQHLLTTVPCWLLLSANLPKLVPRCRPTMPRVLALREPCGWVIRSSYAWLMHIALVHQNAYCVGVV